jgi:hypothetical protein
MGKMGGARQGTRVLNAIFFAPGIGVNSNAHARINAIGKSNNTVMMKTVITQDGASKARNEIDANWISNHATIA